MKRGGALCLLRCYFFRPISHSFFRQFPGWVISRVNLFQLGSSTSFLAWENMNIFLLNLWRVASVLLRTSWEGILWFIRSSNRFVFNSKSLKKITSWWFYHLRSALLPTKCLVAIIFTTWKQYFWFICVLRIEEVENMRSKNHSKDKECWTKIYSRPIEIGKQAAVPIWKGLKFQNRAHEHH